MGITHGVQRADLKPSDHIYTYKKFGLYSHHGIYVGNDEVIHLNQRNCDCIPENFEEIFGIHRSCLDCFMDGDSLRRYEYGANVLGFLFKRLGTCTLAKSDPPDVVVSTTMQHLEQGFGRYDILMNNCEDFALYCKTGLLVNRCDKLGRSGQASFALSIPEAAVLSLPLAVLFPSLALVLAVGIHAIDKYGRDVSKRDDVVKVPVEILPHFRWFRKKVACDKRVSLQVEGRLTKHIRKDAPKTTVEWPHDGRGRTKLISRDVFARNMLSNLGLNSDDDFDPLHTRPRRRNCQRTEMHL